MTRDTNMYSSTNANANDIALPCMFCQEQFGFALQKILMPVEHEPRIEVGEYPSGFPRNVTSYLWTHAGASKGPDGPSPWFALGQLESGAWFYFFAKCPDTPRPFADPGACIHLYVAWNFENLIHYAMDQEAYELYLKESRDQIDANTQTSHRALGASGLSGVAGLLAPSWQSPLQMLHALGSEYRAGPPDLTDSSEIQESSSAHTEEGTELSDASHPPDHPDS